MAYATGSANDMTALRTAIFSACTDNGWTLSGEVIHKGNCYIRIQVVGTTLQFIGGTGIDGSNALTGVAPAVVRIVSGQTVAVMSFPITYEIHVNADPDEVYVFVNYNVTDWQWAAFGLSDVSGIDGTGVWFSASSSADRTTQTVAWVGTPGGGGNQSNSFMFGMFYLTGLGAQIGNSFIHDGLDGGGWSPSATGTACAHAWAPQAPLYGILPNAWNNEPVLLPISVYKPRSSGNKISLVADLRHARLFRIDFHDPGEVITLGTDQWKVYPWYRKDSANRNGSDSSISHSGTMGVAVRYTGE